MALTEATLLAMLEEVAGIHLGDAEIQRLLPLAERQLERLRELRELDLGGEDPRTTRFINDWRLSK